MKLRRTLDRGIFDRSSLETEDHFSSGDEVCIERAGSDGHASARISFVIGRVSGRLSGGTAASINRGYETRISFLR